MTPYGVTRPQWGNFPHGSEILFMFPWRRPNLKGITRFNINLVLPRLARFYPGTFHWILKKQLHNTLAFYLQHVWHHLREVWFDKNSGLFIDKSCVIFIKNVVAVAAYSRLASRSQAKFHTKKLSPLVRPCAAAPAQSTTSAYRSLRFSPR